MCLLRADQLAFLVMFRSLPFRLLLLLTFTVGQWLAVMHATQHELSPVAKADNCVVCSLSHGNGGPAPLPPLPTDLSSKSVAPAPLPDVVFPELRAARARSRAPPVFLA